ncbi:MAG: pseudouridine synthase, partial [Myxococcota bacterium]
LGRGQASKVYWALVARTGVAAGRCALALAGRGRKMVVASLYDDGAQPADTRWRPAGRYRDHTLLACITRTGRRHQIRVHLAQADMPIVGDVQYDGPEPPRAMVGHFLHARSIVLPHPGTGQLLRVAAPLPAERQAVLDSLAGADRTQRE